MERHETLSVLARCCQRSGPAFTQEESVRRLKVIDAFRERNWDAFMKILSTVRRGTVNSGGCFSAWSYTKL